MAHQGYDLLKRLLDCPAETTAAVEHVCLARRQELARLGIPVAPVAPDLGGGRIPFTNTDTDLCGVATASSGGFYDLAPLVELADTGMDMIPVQSVEWEESLDMQWPASYPLPTVALEQGGKE